MSTLDGLSELDDSGPGLQKAANPVAQRLTRRETLLDVSSICVWVLASDLLLYHSSGYAAWALFLFIAAAVLIVGRRSVGAGRYTLAVALLIGACSLRLAWCGSIPAVLSGVALVTALSMSINGTPPYLPDLLRYCLHVLVGSGFRLSRFSLRSANAAKSNPRARYGVLLPLVVVTAFSVIFILANPNLYEWIDGKLQSAWRTVSHWLQDVDPLQFVFWFVSGWIAIGLMYPAADYLLQGFARPPVSTTAPSDSYVAVRNMMISVVLLFAAYLVFEFSTLWFRQLPKGFYYAGYAHEGAFWLTVALAMSTLILSMAFRGSVINDQRVAGLKRWAWVWSIENFLLGVAVVHRLFIYIDFNGMTRMRVIGLLGTFAVIIGFALVVYKIAQGRGFLWLARHQLWTVALVAMFYTIAPVDYCVHRYNAGQIMAGNPAPSTQIPTHETSAEGWLPLVTLLECKDASIRSGMEATLANWLVKTPIAMDWRDGQWANQALRERLQPYLPRLDAYMHDRASRESEMARFHNYVYQWY